MLFFKQYFTYISGNNLELLSKSFLHFGLIKITTI
jgi:hypothetical protein